MGKKSIFDNIIFCYAGGCYLIGASVILFFNLLINIPWYVGLFYFIVLFPTGLALMSRSKRLSKELRKKRKKKKNDKKKK